MTAGQAAVSGLSVVVALAFTIPESAVDLLGHWALLGVALAGLDVGLTLWTVLELLGGVGDNRGAYMLVHQTLGSLGGFLTGWLVCAGSAALAGAAVRAAAVRILTLLPALQASVPDAAVALVALLIASELVCIPRHHRATQLAVWTVFLAAVLFAVAGVLAGMPYSAGRSEAGVSSTLPQALALLSVQYLALESMLGSLGQIQRPRRDIPRAAMTVLLSATVLLMLTAATATSPGGPVVATVCLILGARQCLHLAGKQLFAMGGSGHLPAILLQTWRPFRVPPLPLAVASGLVALLSAMLPGRLLVAIAAGSSLLVMALLNAAAIHSHRSQPERQRWLVVPFAPLLPGVAIAVNLYLLGSLSGPPIVVGTLWVLVGMLVYAAYGRHGQASVRSSACVYGAEVGEKVAGAYRILVPISSHESLGLLMNLATSLASQRGGDVIPLQVIPAPDPQAMKESRGSATDGNALLKWPTRLGADAGVPVFPISRLAHTVPEGILDTAREENCDLVLMSWLERTPSRRHQMGRVLDPVVRGAPCDVAVLALGREDTQQTDVGGWSEAATSAQRSTAAAGASPRGISRILVPGAGGPHAPLALSLAVAWAREYDASVTAVYVAGTGASGDELAAGQRTLDRTVEHLNTHALDGGQVAIEARVIEAEDAVEGIVREAVEHDLVLLGASEESLLDQVVFGSVPEQVALATSTPVIMVKKYRGLPRLWLLRLWNALFGALPRLATREQAVVYRDLRRGARPDADFFVMMGLATIIASMGLLNNSTAVIIGAMLVAPLFTPIIALSMAIVRSDARLLALAMESTLKGVTLSVGLSAALAWLSPLAGVTSEISLRAHPNLPDLAVALASGAAGAYAIARKDVAASLPGVGIAAALVPPLCTVGIGLSIGDVGVAAGAGLLFFTNLVSIALAGASTLLVLGFRARQRKRSGMALRRALPATVVVLVLAAIPLGAVFVDSVKQARLTAAVRNYLDSEPLLPGALEWTSVEVQDQGTAIVVHATLHTTQAVSSGAAEELSAELSGSLGRPVTLRLAAIMVTEGSGTPR